MNDEGQAIIEFLIATGLVLVILMAIGSVGVWLKGLHPSRDSMLGKTYSEAPYTGASSEGVNAYAVEDVLLH